MVGSAPPEGAWRETFTEKGLSQSKEVSDWLQLSVDDCYWLSLGCSFVTLSHGLIWFTCIGYHSLEPSWSNGLFV